MQQYAQALLRAIQGMDGAAVAALLDIRAPEAQARAHALLAGIGVSARGGGGAAGGGSPTAAAAAAAEHLRRTSALRDGWERVAACCLCASAALQASGGACDVLVLAYTREALQENAFQQVLQDAVGSWIVAPLLRLVADCVAICAAPGCFPTRMDRDSELQALVDPVRNLFSSCINDKSSEVLTEGKRIGSLAIANLLLKLNFRLNVPKQCTPVLQALQRPILSDPARLAAFPTAQVVTLKYYMGRLNMYEDKYAEAEADLFFAFRHCHCDAQYHSQRRRILEALIPVRLMLGILPSARLLHEYGFTAQYSGIVAGLRDGNIPAYRSALEEHLEAFIRCGVYLTLDKLQLYVLRTLTKRL
jgi:hypothetical protein